MTDLGDFPWLLLIHQLPAEPAYLRVKVSRRLKRLGAIAVKSSVYALPASEEAREDFVWLRQEIVAAGGEATIVRAGLLEGHSDEQLREQFSAERDAEYSVLADELRSCLGGEATESDLRRFRARLKAIVERDFFDADGRFGATRALSELEQRAGGIRTRKRAIMEERPSAATWVTRKGVRIDRIASAWLIRRCIDPQARFVFVDPEEYRHRPGELRFDMYEGEFTHDGDLCTFEVLLRASEVTGDPALQALAQIVHDLDLKDDRYQRPETLGVAAFVKGITARHADDHRRLAEGATMLEALYSSLSEGGAA